MYTLGPDFLKRARNLEYCAEMIASQDSATLDGEVFVEVTDANFCRERLCPVCAGLKSRKMGLQVASVYYKHKELYPSEVPILLTLTKRNNEYPDLKAGMKELSDGFLKLRKRQEFVDAVTGWYSCKEVTTNYSAKQFHPHMHILMMVPKAYFDKKRGLYIEHDTWVRLWQECLGVDYKPSVYVNSVMKRVGKTNKRGQIITEEGAIAEVTKYVVKPGDVLCRNHKGEIWADPEIVRYLQLGLKGAHLTAKGGTFRVLAKEVGWQDVEDTKTKLTDGAHIPPEAVPVARAILQWRVGANLEDSGYVEVLRQQMEDRFRKAA
jgi:plasmid rolling circle replication initiator protein Rep